MPGVSHNYGRDHSFNVWFTLTVPCEKSIDDIIERLSKDYKISAIYSLPAEKSFKINVNCDFGPQSQKQETSVRLVRTLQIFKPNLSNEQIGLIRQLQEDSPVIPEPFEAIANATKSDVDTVLRQIKDWKESGLIRRFGASIRHQKAGFTAKGMVVFEIESQQLDKAGHLLTQYSQVSHCYQPPTVPDWPYNLFAMTHCQSSHELRELVNQMIAQVKPKQYDILLSTVEYKKTNVKYFVE